MSSEWKTFVLRDVASIIGGGTPSTKEATYWDGNIPWLTPKDLSSHTGMYVKRGERSITKAGLDGSSAKIVPPGTVLFTSRAPIGYLAIAEQAISTNQGFKSLVLNTEQDNRFFYYLLRFHTPDIEAIATGSTFKEISGSALGSFEVTIPSYGEQTKIADILTTLDDRIELLRETNATLEAIAQALFKSWFVDFDPVRAKQEGREPEGMDADTAALFPDSFEESELGLVPKGWKIGKVDNILSRLSAKVRYTKDQIITDGVIPIYEQGAGILLGYHNGPAQFLADERNPAFIFGDHTCVTHLSCEPFDISQNVIPLKGKDRATLWVYYAVKDKQAFQEYRRHWMELIVKDIVIPTPQICEAYANIVSIYHLKMESNVHQLRTITSIRDTLLPRLISGQLRIPEAEALIEETAA